MTRYSLMHQSLSNISNSLFNTSPPPTNTDSPWKLTPSPIKPHGTLPLYSSSAFIIKQSQVVSSMAWTESIFFSCNHSLHRHLPPPIMNRVRRPPQGRQRHLRRMRDENRNRRWGVPKSCVRARDFTQTEVAVSKELDGAGGNSVC